MTLNFRRLHRVNLEMEALKYDNFSHEQILINYVAVNYSINGVI